MTTEIVRPVYHSNSRTEFLLPKKVCLSNIRMINVGCAVDAAALAYNPRYPISSGVQALMENVYLYANDNQEVSVLRNASKFLAYQNSRKPNDEEFTLMAPLVKSALGFHEYDGKIGFDEGSRYCLDIVQWHFGAQGMIRG